MDTAIPDIRFNDSILPEVGFEVIELHSLYQRAATKKSLCVDRPHRVHFHNLILFTGNEGEHFIDFNRFQVGKGCVVLVNRGQIHAFDMQNQPAGKLIIFTDAYLERVATAIDIRIFSPIAMLTSYLSRFQLSSAQASALLGVIDLIANEYQLKVANNNYLQVLFAALLTKVGEAKPTIYHQQINGNQIKHYEQFIKLLSEKYQETRDANVYAKWVGTTYKTLNQTCKAITQQTAKQVIDSFIILEAKRRLSIDSIQIQQLAELLGFDEATNFVKFFKKHTSLTPTQFKKIYKVRH